MDRSQLPPARALVALSLLASSGSLTEAAEKLGVTRSALSHRIADLQRRLGVLLVRKKGRGLSLTEDGEKLIAGVGDALDQIDAALRPFNRSRGQIRLSTVATFASHWLIPRLPEFQARYPQTEISIFTTTRPVDLRKENFDCAIRHGSGSWKSLSSTLLFRETLMPIASPNFTDHLLSTDQLAWPGAVLIRARTRFIDWSRWQKAHPAISITRRKWLTVETRAQALDAALAGAGVALMDMAYISTYIAQGRLNMLAQQPLQLRSGYYFVHAPDARSIHLLNLLRTWILDTSRPVRARQ